MRTGRWWAIGAIGLIGFVAAMLTIGGTSHLSTYGQIALPGAMVVQLPARTVDLTFAAEQGDIAALPVPALAITVAHVTGDGPDPDVREDIGTTVGNNGDDHVRIARVKITSAGEYRVTVAGDVGNYLSPRLLLGHGTDSGVVKIVLITVAAIVAVLLASLAVLAIGRRSVG